jgi:hypothetical protein
MKQPLEALDGAICYGLMRGYKSGPGPGGIVDRLSKESREALSRLTSNDLARVRVPEYVCRVGGRRGRASLR